MFSAPLTNFALCVANDFGALLSSLNGILIFIISPKFVKLDKVWMH